MARGGCLFARCLTGIGEAAFICLSPSLIDDIAPPSARSRWLAVFFSMLSIGYALGFLGAGIIASLAGWSWVFATEALVTLPFAILCYWLPNIRGLELGGADATKPEIANATGADTPPLAFDEGLAAGSINGGSATAEGKEYAGAIDRYSATDAARVPNYDDILAGDALVAGATAATPTASAGHAPDANKTFMHSLRLLAKNPIYILMTLGYCAQTFVFGALSFWVHASAFIRFFHRPRVLLAFLCFLSLMNYYDRGAFIGVMPLLTEEFGFSDSEAGLIGGSFIVGYALVSPVAAQLSRYVRSGPLLMVGMLAWCIATGMCFFANGFWFLMIAPQPRGLGQDRTRAPIVRPGVRLRGTLSFPPGLDSTRAGIYLSAVLVLIAYTPIQFAVFMPSAVAFLLIVALGEFFLLSSLTPVNAVFLSCVSSDQRGHSMAVMTLLIHLLGDMWSPYIFGAISDASSKQVALFCVAAVLIMTAAFWCAGALYARQTGRSHLGGASPTSSGFMKIDDA
ncbi:hypothetical protein H696_04203 [Fonticula alba]|uniref:Major facilitator superfamily (MFS) profile domain-containing protein n=1 Tax=Fonticula alba TaxID=691883 RepID=A0A058Z3A6_FONAL|nr:hypothetical protein H696_04203 [Fonticula alba]KCV68784.1 hypothetical protein H696_04203 [Fonticula alba]|eukprot:XP_009496355.1 hypothetical protein H696_04203 [Fonticula alba]